MSVPQAPRSNVLPRPEHIELNKATKLQNILHFDRNESDISSSYHGSY